MSTALTPGEVDRYRERGIHFPVRVLAPAEVAPLRSAFRELEAREGGRVSARTNLRAHLLLRWVNDLMRDARILDAVESLIGPDILLWASGFFAKHPGDGSFVSWHQDATYWGLSGDDVVTAWVALSPSTPASGCMRVLPGSQRGRVAHRDTFAAGNLLSRGQEISVEVDEREAVDVVLDAGEMSLHHVLIHHGSGPNRADDDRIGLALRYIPTRLRQTAVPHDTASLVRGTDRFGHFEPEPIPARDFDADAVRYHRENAERHTAMLYAGAARRRDG